jgi:AraC family transcriptional activator of pobA
MAPVPSAPLGSIRASYQVLVPARGVGPLAVHEFAVLGFMTGGRGVLQQRGRHSMEAGDVFVIPSGERHRLIEGQSPEAWGIRFAPACFGHGGLEGLLTPFTRVSFGASPILRITPDRQEPLHRLCAELERETTRSGARHAELAAQSLLTLILTEVSRANCEEMGAAAQLSPSLTSRALRFIEENCLEPISLRDVANALERSPAHVATTVKQATGKTVLEWIISGRLTEARRRLLHTDERIDIIAERVGYADPNHFIRMFRRVHGVTPSAYRARAQGKAKAPAEPLGRSSRSSRPIAESASAARASSSEG